MPRVKRGTKRRASRKKTLALAKGFFLTKSKLHRSAQEAVEKSLRYGYIGRRLQEARFPLPVDRAHRRGLPSGRDFLQPVHERSEEGRHRTESQDAGRHGDERSAPRSPRW